MVLGEQAQEKVCVCKRHMFDAVLCRNCMGHYVELIYVYVQITFRIKGCLQVFYMINVALCKS